jgi:hypothetical protein
MKRAKIFGLCLIALLTGSAIASAGASAALPELGRCVKVAVPHTGKYKYASCVVLAAGSKGSFNWEPGPGALKKFEGSTTVTTVLETSSKIKISCAGGTFNGEYTGAKTLTATVDLINCENLAGKAKCQSNPAKEGEIEDAVPLEGELGFIAAGEKPLVGLDLKAKSPGTTIVTFECGKLPEVFHGTLEGSVIARIKPIEKMAEEFTMTYKQTNSKQLPEQFEGGAKDTLATQLLIGTESSTQATGLTSGVLIPNEEPLEIKAK